MEKASKKQRPHIKMGKAEDKEEEEDDSRLAKPKGNP